MTTSQRVELVAALAIAGLSLGGVASCSGSSENSTGRGSDFGGVDGESKLRDPGQDGRRCPSNEAYLEESLDTSGDNVADVRKVFRVEGEGEKAQKIIVCRELDLDHDGRKDLFRFYNEDGRPLREMTDSDFDGRVDQISYFENGRVIKQEADRNNDGRADETRFFVANKLIRVDRDDDYDGEIDVWEHWDSGRLLRIGYDTNRDKVADFWHRAPPAPGEEDDSGGEEAPAEEDGGEDDVGAAPATKSSGSAPPAGSQGTKASAQAGGD
jgi:hypothetical protein